jgi:hypothetical protein
VSSIGAAYGRTGLSAREAWLRYLALGGTADEVSVAGQLHGLVALSPAEYNVLAHAINEALDDLPRNRQGDKVAYRDLHSGQRRRGRD